MKPEHSFRTYQDVSPDITGETPAQRNARYETERAMRYINQASTAMRLAREALVRAREYLSRD
jgi:hypothetical protein